MSPDEVLCDTGIPYPHLDADGRIVFKDRTSEGFTSVWQKLRDLGSRFHLAVGIVAMLVLIYFVVRFLLIAFERL